MRLQVEEQEQEELLFVLQADIKISDNGTFFLKFAADCAKQ